MAKETYENLHTELTGLQIKLAKVDKKYADKFSKMIGNFHALHMFMRGRLRAIDAEPEMLESDMYLDKHDKRYLYESFFMPLLEISKNNENKGKSLVQIEGFFVGGEQFCNEWACKLKYLSDSNYNYKDFADRQAVAGRRAFYATLAITATAAIVIGLALFTVIPAVAIILSGAALALALGGIVSAVTKKIMSFKRNKQKNEKFDGYLDSESVSSIEHDDNIQITKEKLKSIVDIVANLPSESSEEVNTKGAGVESEPEPISIHPKLFDSRGKNEDRTDNNPPSSPTPGSSNN